MPPFYAWSAPGQGSRSFVRFLRVLGSIRRGLLAHAKDDAAKEFYEKWGFVAAVGLPYHLCVLTNDVQATLTG